MKKKKSKELQEVNTYAAGIDIGSRSHFVAVSKSLCEENVREFSTFTSDLIQLSDWLKSLKITTVAMESTGIYWIPIYNILTKEGIDVKLVNARNLKNVPGRKTDVLDCQWIQQLHSFGLLSGAFIPEQIVCELRDYSRHRDNVLKMASSNIQLMQKALHQMNILLHNVVSDITGQTGMLIIGAILSGERDASKLAELRDKRCKSSKEVIEKSLQGNYQKSQIFALKQAFDFYKIFQQNMQLCDEEMKKQLEEFEEQSDVSNFQENKKNKKKQKNAVSFEVSKELYKILGVDVTAIDGIGENTALKIISEVGTDMRRWKSEKHFSSWLCLSPGSKISGGKNQSGRTKKSSNRAALAFRLAANALHFSDSALGAYFRRMKARLGAPKAITATAHKLARIFYSMLKNKKEYADLGQSYYEEAYKNRALNNLKSRAKKMGYELLPIST